VPSARWHRSAASRTVYQRSISPGISVKTPNVETATLVPEIESSVREHLGGPPCTLVAESVTQIAADSERKTRGERQRIWRNPRAATL